MCLCLEYLRWQRRSGDGEASKSGGGRDRDGKRVKSCRAEDRTAGCRFRQEDCRGGVQGAKGEAERLWGRSAASSEDLEEESAVEAT